LLGLEGKLLKIQKFTSNVNGAVKSEKRSIYAQNTRVPSFEDSELHNNERQAMKNYYKRQTKNEERRSCSNNK